MASDADCCNLALSYLRQNVQIANLSTDQSSTARLLRIQYPLTKQELLTSHPWNFCKNRATLVQVGTNPNPVWAFEYAPPGDMLFPRRILGVTANTNGTLSANIPANAIVELGNLFAPQEDSNTNTIRFELAQSTANPAVMSIFTNQLNAILEYTQNMTSEGQYPPKFFKALAAQLASEIAPTLTNGDPYSIGPKLESFAKKKFSEAMAEDLNSRMRFPADAEAIRVRGGAWW